MYTIELNPIRLLRSQSSWTWKKTMMLLGLPAVAAVAFVAFSAGSPPSIPAINLSADPLYAASVGDKPALALALSVEYPTVGAQYVDPDNNNGSTTDDPTYSPTIEYLGYYDAESCYVYKDSGETSATKRFVRAGRAVALVTPNTTNPTWTSRLCWDGSKSYTKDGGTFSTTTNDAFSGNFLNWASSSAIDMLRLSLTGGDRVIDTPTRTVLQRAMIPDGDPINMGNSSNFPSKRLYRTGTSRAIVSAGVASPSYASGVPYFGAVPSSMATAAGTNDIFVANTLNRIYFGTAKAGNNSSSFTSYTLGGNPATVQKGPSATYAAALPTDAVLLGGEGVTYTFSGVKEIWFGKNDATTTTWTVLPASGGIDCYWQGGGGPYGGINDSRGGIAKNCYARPYSGTWTPTPGASGLNTDGYFFARVQVCDRDSSFALIDNRYWSLCSRYSDGATTPHANYKPIGAIQKYADQLRLSAFGYLLDQNNTRYGGVLRSPTKYVGSKTFDISGVENTASGGNPNREWDPLTGVFTANPDLNSTVPTTDGRAAYLSGVINYVNQFGRTGSVAGRYKIYDPIGELHYQAVRYFQGLQPTPGAVSGITTVNDLYDGYPVYTTWTDPYGGGRLNSSDYSCLKSNIVMIGDKNTWDYNNRLPTASAANNIPDIAYWQTTAQKFESNTSGTYIDGAGATRTISNPNTPNASSVGSASGDVSLVGSAYWARTHDIRGTGWTNATPTGSAGTALQRPGLRVKTFVFDVNEFGGSNSSTTRRTSNQLFRAAKYGGFETDPSNQANNPYNTYGNPFVNEGNGSNDNYVWADTDPRASRVGEANTYFLQSDARGVLTAFDDIFARASTAARSIAGGAIQSKNLTVSDTVYQGTFDTSDWSGDLLAIPITVDTSNVVTVGTTPTWTAATQLGAMTTPATSRNIIVGNSGATANPVAAAFTWSAIEASLKSSLDKLTAASSSDGLAQDRLDYLRGDKSKEGTQFRTRNKLLGDIVNSGVAYSGAPSSSIADAGYSPFYTANSSRTPAVYVGANDGMLHAFNGTNGNELFAYIPSWFGPKLAALTSTTYANSHQSYLDGTPVVAEAKVGSNWKTVLVSGTGGGGKGVFALDVTNPASFTASNVMWEFTNADDADLGFVTGKPQILKLRTSAPSATTATYKYFAVFGSGVNNYVSDAAGIFSSTGQPALFILDLSKASGDAWTLGTNYYKISLPIDSTLSATKATGLINFDASRGLAGEVTQVYMGDLHGNLWKLDFAGFGTADWNMGKLSYFKQGTSNNPIPLFIAKDASGIVQPISAPPNVVYGPIPDSSYVVFGTGKYLEATDKISTATQSYYMVYDNATTTLDGVASSATSAIKSRLRLKTGTTSAGVITVPTFTLGRATTDTDADNPRSGWVVDFPSSKERQISKGTVTGADSLTFGSLYPGVASTSACSNTLGGGNVYTLNISSGNGTYRVSDVGILGEPLLVDLAGATTITPSDSTGRRTKTITKVVIQQGSSGLSAGSNGTNYTQTSTVVTGRMTWRQINNYQDLKNAP